MSHLIYVIPPYLLDTCLGLTLQRQVAQLDPTLASTNVYLPLESVYLRQPEHIQSTSGAFCNDPTVNDVIKDKFKEKMAVIGILGLAPDRNVSDDYILSLYQMFQGRLASSPLAPHLDPSTLIPGSVPVSSGSPNLTSHAENATNDPPSSSLSKNKRSVFDIPRLGEFIVGPQYADSMPTPKRLARLSSCSLESLLAWAKLSSEHKYFFFPFLHIASHVYLSPLPMYWTPLVVDKPLEYLEENLSMLVATSDGYSSLRFAMNPNAHVPEDVHKKNRYFNFIANNEINENCGIFYYELLVSQSATAASDYKPLIRFHDPLLSSSSSLFMSVGFVKRNVKFDKMPASANSGANVQSLDLKTTQSNIALYHQSINTKKLDDDTLTFLGAEPGVSLEGSFAVNFNKSCSYAPIKSSDSNFRTSSLNMNRRFSQLNRQLPAEQGSIKIDMDIPFKTRTQPPANGVKTFETDTIGCGVNFIDETIFITLNGVLVKTLSTENLTSNNRFKDSLFHSDAETKSLFPLIGFQVTDGLQPSEGAMPESVIKTNFGLKEFEFNIRNYVREVKERNNTKLLNQVGEETHSGGAGTANRDVSTSAIHDDELFEHAIENIKDDLAILNEFIKGYLIQEGYLETLDAFKSDLNELDHEVSTRVAAFAATTDAKNSAAITRDEEIDELIEKSNAQSRSTLKQLIILRHYTDAIEYLGKNFGDTVDVTELQFELRFQQYVALIDKYLSCQFGNEFDFQEQGVSKGKISQQVVEYGKQLLAEVKAGSAEYERITKVSGALLVQSKAALLQMGSVHNEIKNQTRNANALAEKANAMILEHMKFEKHSKLEKMINGVGNNIERLCNENDNLYKLVNYERDFVDV